MVCPKFMLANGELVSEFYEINEGDQLETGAYYTLGQLLEFMDLSYEEGILINQLPAKKEDRVYENFSVTYPLYKQSSYSREESYEQSPYTSKDSILTEQTDTKEHIGDTEKKESEIKESVPGIKEARLHPTQDETDALKEESITKAAAENRIQLVVNDETVTLAGKESYILVDILDVYPFDFSTVRGQRVIITCNGEDAEFTRPIDGGDYVRIYWEQ